MSVLFQALHKAARDYRDQKFPVVVPLLPLVPKANARARLAKTGFTIAVMTAGVAFSAIWLLPKPAATQTPIVPIAAAVAAPAPVVAAAPLPESPPLAQAKPANEEPLGIVLPVNSLAVPSMEENATAEVTKQLQDVPAVANAVKKKAPAPHIVVSTTGAPPATGASREARALVDARQYDEAIALYDEALEKDGNNQAAWTGKIYALQQSGSPEALAELDKMIELRPFSAAVPAAKAQILMREGGQQEALSAWRRAVELEPANKNYRLSLAILCDRMGKDEEALALYRQIPSPLPYAVQQRVQYLAARAALADKP